MIVDDSDVETDFVSADIDELIVKVEDSVVLTLLVREDVVVTHEEAVWVTRVVFVLVALTDFDLIGV